MEQIDVRILDRDYRLAVSPDQRERLLEAVAVVDGRMRALRDSGRVAGIDRIAVMAALQLANELLGAPAAGAGTAMPWEGPLDTIMQSLSGPVAKAVGIIAIVLTGLGFAFAEGGSAPIPMAESKVFFAADAGAATPIVPDDVKVTATVTITYEIKDLVEAPA